PPASANRRHPQHNGHHSLSTDPAYIARMMGVDYHPRDVPQLHPLMDARPVHPAVCYLYTHRRRSCSVSPTAATPRSSKVVGAARPAPHLRETLRSKKNAPPPHRLTH